MPDERIDRYVADDMTPEERAAFERELEQDAALRAELEEVREILALSREWASSPPPGEERARAIPVPQLPARVIAPPARVVPLRRVTAWALRAAAVLAIFSAGYYAGSNQMETPTEKQLRPESRPVEVASNEDYRRVTDRGGEIAVETARSYWVIDPSVEFEGAASGEKR
jgi:anti-sigma factor RsiW